MKTKAFIGALLLILSICFYFFLIDTEEAVKINQSSEKKPMVSNKVILSGISYDYALLFIKSIIKKEKYFGTYTIYSSKQNENEFLTSIQISEGALKILNQAESENKLLEIVKVGQGKQFYECIRICLSEEMIKGGMCSCGSYFIGY